MLRKDLKMAGRHLWPPSCRAVGAARSRSLLVLKEPCLPSHHHHHQQDPSPHIKKQPFLGSGMMGRELKAAHRQIGSPSCDIIPTRRSAALPVKEPNGHMTSNGEGSPSAGLLSPSDGEGFPSAGVLLPPSDGGGFPSAGVLSPSDDGGPPSAGPVPPDSWRDSSRQQQTSVEAKIDDFLDMNMLRRFPIHCFRPSSCCLAVKEADVGVHQVACGGGGSPPTGLLLLVSRPDPSRHQQRRPLLAAAGSLPSSVGYYSAAATPPRCCSGAVRRALVAGCFFPTTGLRNAAPSKMWPRRFFATIPPPQQTKVDLLKVDSIWAVGGKSRREIDLGAEKILPSDKEHSPMLMDETKMLASLNLDIEACNNFQEKEVVLKKFYENRILPALEPRGLIARHSLHDKPGIALHQEFKSIASEPKYITSLELTVELISMPEKFWTRCFDFLCEQRCFITENWSEPLGVSIGIFVFDRTMSFDGSHVYRGECDASYYKGKGQACCAIWNSKNELLSSILVKKFDCHTSCMAEVIAMWILLKEAMRMGLQNSSFQACSDSSQVYKILCGTLLIEIEPNDNDGAAKVNKLLKFMRRYFNNLLPRWESREKLFLVDGIMRKGNVAGNEGNEDAVGQSSVAWKNSLVRRMAYYLTGNPVFKLTRKKSKFIKGLNTQRSNPLDIELEEACYVEVDEEHKIDATWHITSALRPGRLYIIMKDLDSRVDCTDELKHLFGKFVSRYDEEGHSLFTIDLEETRIPTGLINETHKSLMIIFDATIAKEEPEKILGIRDLFTVFLTTESEGYLVSKLQKLSPLSFVSFYKGSSAPKKNEDDKRVHEDHNVDDMPCGPDEESQDS